MTITCDALLSFLTTTLEPELFKDYAPNGLQVRGRTNIDCVVTGVTANAQLFDKAIALKADAIIVHHGLFWKGSLPVVTGPMHTKLKKLLDHDINLIAYHLPLDAHPEYGNNAQLGKHLQVQNPQAKLLDNNPGLLWQGALQPQSVDELSQNLETALGKKPIINGQPTGPIQSVAWCTGGAHRYLPQAIDLGVDAYITGEVSLPMAELAMESNIALVSAGHHATERGGVQALSELLKQQFQLTTHFVDIEANA